MLVSAGIFAAEGQPYNAPFKAEQYFTNQEDFLVRGEEDDEQEASHDKKGAEHNLPGSKGSNKPTIDEGTED